MVALELQRMVEQMLSEPGSTAYEAAKEILNSRPTLWDAVDAAGLTAGMSDIKKAETYWIFAHMPDEMSDKILQRVRVALNAGLPVKVTWEAGEWNASAGGFLDSAPRAQLNLHVTTPVPDLSQLQPGAFAGAMA
jgi:hypothetical protein